MQDSEMALAEAIRQACLERALAAYEAAGISGLCAEGRWELAVQAIRGLDLAELLAAQRSAGDPQPRR